MRRWVLASMLVLVAPASWAQVALGPDFQVNTYTTGSQYNPGIASDAAGNFVVVWTSAGQDGSGTGIFARKYSALGSPFGSSEFRVNSYTTYDQRSPSVASDASGDNVVVWAGSTPQNPSGIFGRRFDANGLPGPEFAVNTGTSESKSRPQVAMNAAGQFVVAWESHVLGGYGYYVSSKILAQRYDAAGAPVGAELQVNAYTTANATRPAVSVDGAGNFLVVWGGGSVHARRYDAGSAGLGPELLVNSHTGDQSLPSVAPQPDGGFVVVWSGDGDGSSSGVFGQRIDASGARQGLEFGVNQDTSGPQEFPRVSSQADGRFVVAWMSYGDGSSRGLAARAFTASGAPEGDQFQVNSYTTGSQYNAAVASQPGGRFVVAWANAPQIVPPADIAARRMATDVLFHDGFEAGTLSAWSSASTGNAHLFPSVFGAMNSTSVGLQADVTDTTSLYVEDDSPADENRYRARFWLDTNGFDPGEAKNAHRTRMFIVFEEAPTRRLAAIVLKRQNGVYSLAGRCRLDSGAQADTGFFEIKDGPHAVELDWKRASSALAGDGSFELWIDGISMKLLKGLSNSVSAVDFVRLGALNVKAGAAGTLFWDEFESRRISYIGN